MIKVEFRHVRNSLSYHCLIHADKQYDRENYNKEVNQMSKHVDILLLIENNMTGIPFSNDMPPPTCFPTPLPMGGGTCQLRPNDGGSHI